MWTTRTGSRLDELEKKLAELDEAYGRVVELEADWQDWLHKIRNVLARLNQRARAEEENGPVHHPPQHAMNPAALRLLGIQQETRE